LPLPPDQKR